MMKRLTLLLAPLFLAGCLSHPPPPPAPYHAYGKDRAWDLIIDDKNVTFIPAGQQPITEPRPEVIVGIAGEIYQAGRINVNIVHGPCVIADRSFANRVQVYVDGAQYEGCGGDVVAAAPDAALSLDGMGWHVALVNAQPTPAVGDYSMRFTNGELTRPMQVEVAPGERVVLNSDAGSIH